MIFKVSSCVKSELKKQLDQIPELTKCQKFFIVEIIVLFISIKGRLNFMQFARFGKFMEQTYRNHFAKFFDFLTLNINMIKSHASHHLIIAFDPSYVPKSGKFTKGVDYFWSGVAGMTKWGLEISGIAAVDVSNHTAFHIEAVQTLMSEKFKTLLEFYADVLKQRAKELQKLSKYLVVDAYFSKNDFVACMLGAGFEVVSRLRSDASLRYLYIGPQKKGRGRPKKYGGKINFKNLDLQHFKLVFEDQKQRAYHAIVNSKSLKRDINLVIVKTLQKGQWNHKLYFSTDLNLAPKTLLEYYQARFQIEFIFRDAKQHTGLNHCQARSKEKLHFHWNTSLTAVNLAKIVHWLPIPKEQRPAFSMKEVKTIYHNELMIKRFLSVFAIDPNKKKNKEKIRKLRYYGTRAA